MRALVALFVIASLGSAVLADSTTDAREHYKRGVAAYELGDFKQAIDEFKASYAVYPSPMLLYNLAQSYRKAGSNELALHEYKQYLSKTQDNTPEGRFRVEAREQQQQLEKIIAEQQRIQSAPPPGVVSIPEVEKTPPPVTQPVVQSPPIIVDTPTLREDLRPVHKRAWFWCVVGGAAVAVAVGVGLGVGLSQSSTSWANPKTTLAPIRW